MNDSSAWHECYLWRATLILNGRFLSHSNWSANVRKWWKKIRKKPNSRICEWANSVCSSHIRLPIHRFILVQVIHSAFSTLQHYLSSYSIFWMFSEIHLHHFLNLSVPIERNHRKTRKDDKKWMRYMFVACL